jgi:hypothetical protein
MQGFLRARQFTGACGRLSVLQLIEDGHQGCLRRDGASVVADSACGCAYLERRGPLVADDSGMPVRRRHYWDLYREVADAAGVPPTVWNMHARHDGASEAQQAGVDLADIAEHAQHTDINTTRKLYEALHRALC